MVVRTLPLPGLSPVAGKEVVAWFDGGRLSSDGGLLVLREIERRLAIAGRLAACIDDPRDPGSTVHTLADIIRFRLLMIAAGYEDGNDATGLRLDPLFKMALERLPSGRHLCSPTRRASTTCSCWWTTSGSTATSAKAISLSTTRWMAGSKRSFTPELSVVTVRQSHLSHRSSPLHLGFRTELCTAPHVGGELAVAALVSASVSTRCSGQSAMPNASRWRTTLRK